MVQPQPRQVIFHQNSAASSLQSSPIFQQHPSGAFAGDGVLPGGGGVMSVDPAHGQLAAQMKGFHIQTPVTAAIPAFAPYEQRQNTIQAETYGPGSAQKPIAMGTFQHLPPQQQDQFQHTIPQQFEQAVPVQQQVTSYSVGSTPLMPLAAQNPRERPLPDPSVAPFQHPRTPPHFQPPAAQLTAECSPDYQLINNNPENVIHKRQHIRHSSMSEEIITPRSEPQQQPRKDVQSQPRINMNPMYSANDNSMIGENKEAELTIDDILNGDPFENNITTDTIGSPSTTHNYTHNEEEEDALLSSFIELESSVSPSNNKSIMLPIGLGLDLGFPIEFGAADAQTTSQQSQHSQQSQVQQQFKSHRQSTVASSTTTHSSTSSSSPMNNNNYSGSTNMTPTTPIAPPSASFSNGHSKNSSIDTRSPKKSSTSPSKSHSHGVTKKQIRKSSSFTNGMGNSNHNSSHNPAGPGSTEAFQVHLSNSATIKQQPSFSLSDCSNSFSITSNSSENFSFVMEMAPQSPNLSNNTSVSSINSSNKLRRKSLTKMLPRSSIEKPALRKTQSSYFASDIEAQPQKVLKEMNDGVVIFQLNNSKK